MDRKLGIEAVLRKFSYVVLFVYFGMFVKESLPGGNLIVDLIIVD